MSDRKLVPIGKINKEDILVLSTINESSELKMAQVLGGGESQDISKIRKSAIDWVTDGVSYYLTKKPNTTNGLPAGYYSIKQSYESGPYLQRKEVVLDELFELPSPEMQDMLEDIRTFWSRREKYIAYNITYKRGILLYGPPGTGKTSVTNFLAAEIISKHNGIVIELKDPYVFAEFAPVIRLLEPDKPILAIIEDLDAVLYQSDTKQVLNLLDGNMQIDNIVYVATTNYIDRLEDRVKNRPSRFDRRYEIGYPDETSRQVYITNKLKDDDLKNIDINKWVADTANMSLSHLKELITSCIILEVPYDEAIATLRRMNEVT